MSRRSAAIGGLFVLSALCGAAACSDSDHGVDALRTTVASQTSPATSEMPVGTDVPVSGVLDIVWSPRPTLLAVGGRARLHFALPRGYQRVSLSLGAGPAVLAEQESPERWVASLDVTTEAVGKSELRVDAVAADGRTDSAVVAVPVIEGFSDGSVEVVAGVDEELAVLSIGSGPSEVGYDVPTQGPAIGPTALAFDDSTKTLALLDSANHRVLLMDMTGHVQTAVSLEADGALEGLVSVGGGRLLVTAAGASDGEVLVEALVIDIAQLTVDKFGPFQTETWASGLPLFYSDSDRRVYVGWGGGWYPFFDLPTGSFVPDLVVMTAPYGWARNSDSGSAVGYVVNNVDLTYAFAGTDPSIDIALPLSAQSDWALVNLLDPVAGKTHHYISRFDLTSQTALVVDIAVPRYDHSNSFAVIDQSTIVYFYLTAEGLAIHKMIVAP